MSEPKKKTNKKEIQLCLENRKTMKRSEKTKDKKIKLYAPRTKTPSVCIAVLINNSFIFCKKKKKKFVKEIACSTETLNENFQNETKTKKFQIKNNKLIRTLKRSVDCFVCVIVYRVFHYKQL